MLCRVEEEPLLAGLAVLADGDSVHVVLRRNADDLSRGLDVAEATRVRDALDAWLEEQSEHEVRTRRTERQRVHDALPVNFAVQAQDIVERTRAAGARVELQAVERHLRRLEADGMAQGDGAMWRRTSRGERIEWVRASVKAGLSWERGGGAKRVRIGPVRAVYGVSSDGLEVELIDVHTDEESRGGGFARAFIEGFLDAALASGATRVRLIARASDAKTKQNKLVQFYESLGFQGTGRLVNERWPEMVKSWGP